MNVRPKFSVPAGTYQKLPGSGDLGCQVPIPRVDLVLMQRSDVDIPASGVPAIWKLHISIYVLLVRTSDLLS